MTLSEKKEYAAVDFFKFFCAILVIIIHTKPFDSVFWIDGAIGLVTRFAVPYFFASSAFFLFRKLRNAKKSDQWKIYGQYVLRLVRFYFIWYVIHAAVNALLSGTVFSAGYYLRQFFLSSNGSPLWFLCALIWASFFVFVLSRKLGKKVVFGISLVFWVIGYCLSTLAPLFSGTAVYQWLINYVVRYIAIQNGLFFAFPYIALGLLLSETEVTENRKRDILGIILSFILLMAESLTAVKVVGSSLTFLWLAALPLAYFTLHLTLSLSLKGSTPGYYLRKSSTLVYVLHVPIMKLTDFLFAQSGLAGLDRFHLLRFFAVTVISVLLAFALVSCAKRKGFRFLKYIM